MIYHMLVNVRTSQECFQASQNITTFSPSSKLRRACEQALVTSPSIRAFLRPRISFRPRVTLGEERFAGGLAQVSKQIVNSMAFKLPFVKGKYHSDGSLDCHGVPLFAWEQFRDREEAIGRGSHGLVFVARNDSEKTVIKKLLGEDVKEKRLFLKEAKIHNGIKSEHIVKFKAVFFDFVSFGGLETFSNLDQFL